MTDYKPHITVLVPTSSSGEWTYPNGQYVQTGGTVTLTAPKKSSDLDVYTRQNNNSKDVFQNASQPYKAKSNGNDYTLLCSISGTVTLWRSQTTGGLTSNGTINVGGGGNDGDGGDDDSNG